MFKFFFLKNIRFFTKNRNTINFSYFTNKKDFVFICVSCKYYIPEMKMCKKFCLSSNYCRIDENYCGYEAKYWERAEHLYRKNKNINFYKKNV